MENENGLWLSVKDIAEALSMSVNTIRMKLSDARKKGIQLKEKKKGKEKLYEVNSLKEVFPDHFEGLKAKAIEKTTEAKVTTDPVKELEKIAGDVEEIEEAEELEEFTSIMRIKMNVALEPETLLFYTLVRHKGFDGSLSDFINACVKGYMQSKGYDVAIVTPEEEVMD